MAITLLESPVVPLITVTEEVLVQMQIDPEEKTETDIETEIKTETVVIEADRGRHSTTFLLSNLLIHIFFSTD